MNAAIRTLGYWLMPMALVWGAGVWAQEKPANSPQRPLRIIISVAPGGGADYVARATAQMLSDRWGQNAVVDSRPGGSGVVAVELLNRASPDGHTMMQYGDGMMLIRAHQRVAFDPFKAFDPVVSSTTQPYVLLVQSNLPVRSIKELIDLSSTRPITYSGGNGVGSSVHVGVERLVSMANLKLKYIAYKGAAPSIMAVMGGEIQMACVSAMAGSAAIRTGKVRGLASTGAKRIPSLPDIPTVAEQGVPGYKLTNRYNLWIPAGTPRAITAAINRVVTEGMNASQMVQRLALEGTEPAERLTPQELRATLEREYQEVERTVIALGQKPR
jgi:tripartite-type tricarboxylate transporter receptor subunit TctC